MSAELLTALALNLKAAELLAEKMGITPESLMAMKEIHHQVLVEAGMDARAEQIVAQTMRQVGEATDSANPDEARIHILD